MLLRQVTLQSAEGTRLVVWRQVSLKPTDEVPSDIEHVPMTEVLAGAPDSSEHVDNSLEAVLHLVLSRNPTDGQ